MKKLTLVTTLALLFGALGANAQVDIPTATFSKLNKPCKSDTALMEDRKTGDFMEVIDRTCTISHNQLTAMKALKTADDEVSIHSFKLSFKDGETEYGFVHDSGTLRADVHNMMVKTKDLKKVKIHEVRVQDAKGNDWPEGTITLMIE